MSAGPNSLVLLGRFPGKDRAVAQALAREFGRDDSWGLQVIGAAPIVMLESLTDEQADAIIQALADVEAAGSRFEIQQGVDPSLPKLSWPGPPRIKGKLFTELGNVGQLAPTTNTVLTALVACPYTGKPMKLTLTLQLAPVGASEPAPAPAAPAAAHPVRPIAGPVPTPAPGMRQITPARATPGGAPIAVPVPISHGRPTPSGAQSAYIPVPTPMGNAAIRGPAPSRPASPNNNDKQANIIGLEALDELQAQPAPAPAAPIPVPGSRPPMRATPGGVRQISAGAPLPDVPVLHSSPAPARAPREGSGAVPMPRDLMSAPMDLSTFEANVQSSGIMNPPTDEEIAAAEAELAMDEPMGEEIHADGPLCSVFMGKTNNPKVQQLLGAVLGVPLSEAAKLCQKPIVAIAKDISGDQARGLKEQFASLGISVRITERRL